jgi:hypothetical protein
MLFLAEEYQHLEGKNRKLRGNVPPERWYLQDYILSEFRRLQPEIVRITEILLLIISSLLTFLGLFPIQ